MKIPLAMYRIDNAHDLLDALHAINTDADLIVTLVQDAHGNQLDMFRVWEETLSDGSTAKHIELFNATPYLHMKTKTAYEVANPLPRKTRKARKAAK